jgi:5-methylcytosine-specific restriction endonuclease McrA
MKYTNESIFKVGSTYSRHHLKRKLIKENWIPYECAVCQNPGEWQGSKLVLQLDHVNGVSSDNRIQNLRFICPNCHSQTDTYAGKNSKGMRPLVPRPNARAEKLKRDRTLWESLKNNPEIKVGSWGWKGRASDVIGIGSQKFHKWLLRVDPEFPK